MKRQAVTRLRTSALLLAKARQLKRWPAEHSSVGEFLADENIVGVDKSEEKHEEESSDQE